MIKKQEGGLFWHDEAPQKKVKKEPEKTEPPKPVWLRPEYLPDLQTAINHKWDFFTDEELVLASLDADLHGAKHQLLFDIECYPNYFLLLFQSVTLGKYIAFEMYHDNDVDMAKLLWILEHFTIIGFYSKKYDLIMMSLFVTGLTNEQLKGCSDSLIVHGNRTSDLFKTYETDFVHCDHIDLFEIPKGDGSLKAYGSRLHSKQLRDLPFHPDVRLNKKQVIVTRWYCANDLSTTHDLLNGVSEELELRCNMSVQYKSDLRSKSDAQIAESVIGSAIKKVIGCWPSKVEIDLNKTFKYNRPHFIKYETSLLKEVLDQVINTDFCLSESGKVLMPDMLSELKVNIGNSIYRFGKGGLHSSEKTVSHFADENILLIDRDVSSFYPYIILNQKLFPKQLGDGFLEIYRSIVETRIEAKRSGNIVISESLKILINGSFGKFGSPHSILYSPELLIQVTITGQLSLLMLIERLELADIPVISANTDGIVINCQKHQYDELNGIVAQWEKDTDFDTEETVYTSVHSRDVNNYIAIKTNGKAKRKGVYGDPGLSKNPTTVICSEAVCNYLTSGTPIERSIIDCRDITKFITARSVKGGGVKVWKDNIEYLGKAIRWYYARNIDGHIVYANSGNKVARTEEAKPIMLLPDEFPTDVKYEWYIAEAYKILKEIGLDYYNM